MSPTHTICLSFIDGQTVQFEVTPPEGWEFGRRDEFEQFLKSNYITLELDEGLVMYPRETVRSIQIIPVPTPLPPGVIRDVKVLKKGQILSVGPNRANQPASGVEGEPGVRK